MPTLTLIDERPAPVVAARPRPGPVAPGGRRAAAAVAAMVAGLLATATAAALLVHQPHPARRAPVTAPATPPADPLAITLAARDVAVVTQTYEPGQESGWHAHAGIHAVAVLSGTLTVYDAACQAETFSPGHPYVGGQEAHLVRNQTDAPVTMIVTYLSPSAPVSSSRHLDAPPGCPAG